MVCSDEHAHPGAPAARRASERLGRDTYASTIGALWGSGAAAAVRASIILACAGFLILYLIVLVDVCIGALLRSRVCPRTA